MIINALGLVGVEGRVVVVHRSVAEVSEVFLPQVAEGGMKWAWVKACWIFSLIRFLVISIKSSS